MLLEPVPQLSIFNPPLPGNLLPSFQPRTGMSGLSWYVHSRAESSRLGRKVPNSDGKFQTRTESSGLRSKVPGCAPWKSSRATSPQLGCDPAAGLPGPDLSGIVFTVFRSGSQCLNISVYSRVLELTVILNPTPLQLQTNKQTKFNYMCIKPILIHYLFKWWTIHTRSYSSSYIWKNATH
jgi:hypothetical protein